MAKETKNNLETMRHSFSHILAAAVLDMFPEGKLAIGPAIENGFYYDFELPRTLIPEDLPLLEKKMKHMLKQNLKFERQDMPIDEALNVSKKAKQPYKAELIEDLKKEGKKEVSFYKTGSFIDLCEGPHVSSTNQLGAFKLSHTAGAYWKGDEKNKMLQRIYAYAFETQKELDDFLKNQEELKKRDHRKLGDELELFVINDEIGAGLPVWLPKGTSLRNTIKDFLTTELMSSGYQMVETPHIANAQLWKTSGHSDFYKENMYSSFNADKQDFLVKPMNCPFHIAVYKNRLRSYRELPMRLAEFGTVYRYEKSGVLHGLMRVRGFTQDDAHIICRGDQLDKEIGDTVSFAIRILKSFGFSDFEVYLSTKPDKAVGSDKDWKLATSALESALKKEKINYEVDPGEGVFYGPKIDIKIKDSLGRSWQCSTIQFDFNLPERFKMEYIDESGKKKQPVMIHRALLGSLERFIGVLVEHYGGDFPLWLAPAQVKVIPVSEKFEKFARGIESELKAAELRVELDDSDESVGKKIRNAEIQKIPYMLVVGEKEEKAKKVAVRSRKDGDLGQLELKKLIEKLNKEIVEKK